MKGDTDMITARIIFFTAFPNDMHTVEYTVYRGVWWHFLSVLIRLLFQNVRWHTPPPPPPPSLN